MDMFKDALINILAIIGIIVAGGFIVFFLGDLLLSVLDPKREDVKQEKKVKKAEEKKTKALEGKLKTEKVMPVAKPLVKEEPTEYVPLKEEAVEITEVNNVLADEEAKSLGTTAEKKEEEKPLNNLKSEEEEYRRRRIAAIEERRQVILKEIEKEKVKPEETLNFVQDDSLEDEDEFDFSDISFDDEDVVVKNEVIETEQVGEIEELSETEQVDEAEELSEIEEVTEQNEDAINEEVYQNQELVLQKQELENLKQELLQEREKNNKLLKDAETSKLNILEVRPVASVSAGSLEEYEHKLVVLEERFKINEKELKNCKKEFLPLKKVKNNLDNDKKKLRRREALVAKQKVVLYGVNNYSEIDKEKAEKLAQDLDLLDGLKLSVAHCEEVMTSNKERYPILESTYNILAKTNDNIKSDIDEIKEKIEKLKSSKDSE